MCGIAGYIGSRHLQEGILQLCLELMHRRGPDHQGYFHDSPREGRNIYLLSSRLSIIDLDARSNQPFLMGSSAIAFNGELYNYLEVKTQFISRGHKFRTKSDTEVVLKAINELGLDSLDTFEGMFAFAFYNRDTHEFFLARDRFGEKPLYIYRDETGIYFGSEIKYIKALLGKPLKVNYDHLYRYLVNGYKALYKQPNTFFVGVSEVPAASLLSIDENGTETIRRYWEPSFNQNCDMSYKEAVQLTKEKLIRSVELRLRADVPLAFCMSGGVDSNALISIAKNVFDYDVHGFTVTNTDSRYEEQDMVDHAVSELGIKHTSVPVTVDRFIPQLRTLVKQHDAPVFTINYYAHWLLMEKIRDYGYRISVSGTAADELFTGYYDHHLAYLFEIKNDQKLFTDSIKAWEKYIKPIVRNPYLNNPYLFLDNPQQRGHIFLDSEEFAKYLNTDWDEPFTESHYTDSLLRNRMLNEIFHEATPMILHEDDLNAMYFSIENRSPFLDRDLFEFCNSVPSQYLVRNGFAKVLLRDALEGIVPKKILAERRKVGFNAPIRSFLDLEDINVKSMLLDDSPIYEHIKRDKIEKLLLEKNISEPNSKFIFYFLSSKLFLELFDS